MCIPELETKWLLLREIHPDDAEKIYNCWMKDEDVSKSQQALSFLNIKIGRGGLIG